MKTIVAGRWNRHSSKYPEAKALWKARNAHDADEKLNDPDFKNAQNAITELLITQLVATGASIITDGGFRWDSSYDITRNIHGCSGFQKLSRIPETNHFHRQPVAKLPLSIPRPILISDLQFAKQKTDLPIIISLPGSYSLARQTENVKEQGLNSLTLEYAKILHQEIRTLLEAGADIIKIDEPQILAHPEDIIIFQKAAELLTLQLDISRIALATYYGDITNISGYFNLPFGIFFLDFVDGPANLKALQNFPCHKQLAAGIFDARNPRKDNLDDLACLIRRISKELPQDQLFISTNTDLHFLPWDAALEKVRDMVKFAKGFKNELSGKWMIRHPKSKQKTKQPQPCAWPQELEIMHSAEELRLEIFSKEVRFPTSAVGSYPQNKEMRLARAHLRNGQLDKTKYGAIIEKHTKDWIKFQNEIDLTVPVEGEFFREDMAAFFGIQMNGRLLDFVPSYENRRYRPVEYPSKIQIESPMTVQDFIFTKSLTNQPLKWTLTGPATLADWGLPAYDAYYRNPRLFRIDLARALRAEIKTLIKAGMKILQIDEPALTTKMTNFAADLKAIEKVILGFKDKIYLILHICYSDYETLDKAFPYILALPFHQLHMEMANRGDKMIELIQKYGFGGKDIGFGAVDVHTDRIESVEEIVSGVKRVMEYIPSGARIWLTPDCGLKERNDEVARKKMEAITAAAKICREQFAPKRP